MLGGPRRSAPPRPRAGVPGRGAGRGRRRLPGGRRAVVSSAARRAALGCRGGGRRSRAGSSGGLRAPLGPHHAGAAGVRAGPGAGLLRAAGRLVPAAPAVRRAARPAAAAARPRPAGRAALPGPRAAVRPGPAAAHEQRALRARGRRGARRAPGALRGAGRAARAGRLGRAGRHLRALPPLAAPLRGLRGAHPPAGLGRARLLPGGALRPRARRLRVRPAALPPARAGHHARAHRAAPVQAQGGVPGAAPGPEALDGLQRNQQSATAR